MKRRNFLAAGSLGGYSLVVRAQVPARQGWAPGGEISPAKASMSQAEPHMREVSLDCDVLVAGGGMSGVCAAIAAARHGAKVVLVQDRSRLGGNSSSEVKMHVCGADASGGRPGWREGGLLEEFRLEDAVRNPQRCFELWDLLLYEKVMAEPNIHLLLETTLYSAQAANGVIQAVSARCDRTETLYRIGAKIFLDATGDSRLALEAGAEMRYGREGRAEFNESLAPEKPDRETMGSSLLFTSRLHDRPMPFKPPAWARKVNADQLVFRQVDAWEYGYWWIEWGGHLDTIRDNERIRFELLAIVMGVWDYIKNSGSHPSSANWALDWVGMMPGKRESRRIVGDHILTQGDIASRDFEDAVAIGGWPMDDHPPLGFDRPDLKPAIQILPPDVFNIPLRCLYSRNIANLMMAGRNISASHVAFSSTRVMATCAVIGQAAGTAAAACVAGGCRPRALWENKKALAALQQTLLADDQTIRGVRGHDPGDVAQRAAATASSERDGAEARLVLDGFVRDVPRKESHHWAGKMRPDGAWIELSWPSPQNVSSVQLTFDTGFRRVLTLSAQNSVMRRVVRGPQPETVRDYTISWKKPSGEWVRAASVEGNYQRLRRHQIQAQGAVAIRVHVTATNGDADARIFEVRCYA